MSSTTASNHTSSRRWVGVSGHAARIAAAAVVASAFLLAVAVYGIDYYSLDIAERPMHPKHEVLRPSGTLGLRLGMLGLAMFIGVYLYPIRKKIRFLGRIGKTRHWLDFHILLGLTAPVVVTLHSTFKFQGVAGIAYWLMIAVVLSGIIGRYIYAKIPRSLNSAELSRQELGAMVDELSDKLAKQPIFSGVDLEHVLPSPRVEDVRKMSLLRVFAMMLWFDVASSMRVMHLRRLAMRPASSLRTVGGLLSSGNRDLEETIRLVRSRVRLESKIAFLDRTNQVFHLWHVVHRPFSYSFIVLAAIHIGFMLLLGYY